MAKKFDQNKSIDLSSIDIVHIFQKTVNWEKTHSLCNTLSMVRRSTLYPWPFGYEKKLIKAYAQFHNENFVGDILTDVALGIYYLENGKVGDMLVRPETEVTALSIWSVVNDKNLILDNIGNITNKLGGRAEIRTSPVVTGRYLSGHQFQYLEVPQIKARLKRLIDRSFGQPPGCPLRHCYEFIVEFLIIHPLIDGNGRVSRLLFQALMHSHIGIPVPVFPLSLMNCLSKPRFLKSYVDLYVNEDAQMLVDCLNDAISTLLLIAIHMNYIKIEKE